MIDYLQFTVYFYKTTEYTFIEVISMKRYSKNVEQFCSVLDKNVVFEEIYFHDGSKKVRCINYSLCKGRGGCKNEILKAVLTEATLG